MRTRLGCSSLFLPVLFQETGILLFCGPSVGEILLDFIAVFRRCGALF